MKQIALINGPNLNLLGTREPEQYGTVTLDNIVAEVRERAAKYSYSIWAVQSNHEGELVDAIQKAGKDCVGIVINPAAYTHTSVAIRDALAGVAVPAIEVHISNIYRREEFRRHSLISEVVIGVISGLGKQGYLSAVDALVELIKQPQVTAKK